MTKRTQEQLRKTLSVRVAGQPHGVEYTAPNGAHVIERSRDEHGRVYVLAWNGKEWVVWRELADGSMEWGHYFADDDHEAAVMHWSLKTWIRADDARTARRAATTR
jgi:hypothetical protein